MAATSVVSIFTVGLFVLLVTIVLPLHVAVAFSSPISKRPFLETKASSLSLSMIRDEASENNMNRRQTFQKIALSIVNVACLSPSVASATSENEIGVTAKSDTIAFANKFVKDAPSDTDPLASIPWNISKNRGLNMYQMADAINDGLIENEWFVTGKGRPEFFSEKFVFSDPQVTLEGFENYCRGVRRLFDQETARCELICCSVTGENQITVLWRNSGIVNIGPFNIDLKPYLVTTIFKTDTNDGNLIISQTDEFETDTLGLLLYQVPLLRPLAGPPVDSVDILKQKCDFDKCKML